MREMPYAPGRIEKAVSMLIMAKKILDAWPTTCEASDRDGIAADTAAKLIEQAIKQLTSERCDH
jgi:hypothetical protein